MDRSVLKICCLGMALGWLPMAATAGEPESAIPPAAQWHDRSETWQVQSGTVGVTLVQAAGHAPTLGLKGDEDDQGDGDNGPRWRRTANGWERSELWRREPPGEPAPVFDPILFAALQGMLSLMALIAWPEG